MTIRNDKHVMEDESINILNSFLLPWIVYDLRASDYAIDLYVRIAEINKPVSSDTFQIQLKSKRNIKIKDNKISLGNFPTKTLITFKSSYEPSYIVLCDLNSKKLYWVNVHDEINRLNNTNSDWKKQKTNTIYFNLPQAEFTKPKLKEDVIRIRKKLIIKHSIKLEEDESFEKIYNQMEIETIQEDISSGKIKIKDIKTKTLLLADLNFIKIFNIEYDDVSKIIEEINFTLALYEKTIKKKLFPSNVNHGIINLRISNLFFMLAGYNNLEFNLEKSIEYNKKALKFYSKKEDKIHILIINYNLGLSYKLLYENEPRDEYLLNQINALNNILLIIEDYKIIPILAQINLSIGNLYRELTKNKFPSIKNQSILIKQVKSSIKHFEKSLEYSQYPDDSKELALIKYSIGTLYGILAEFENSHLNLKSSFQYLNAGIKIILKFGNPDEIAEYKTKIAVVYRGLYNYENNKEYLDKSIDYLIQVLEFFNSEEFEWDYANANKNLAMDYIALSKIENTKNNIKKALDALDKVSEVFTKEKYPERFGATQLEYYDAYITLYEKNTNKEESLDNAFNSLCKSLDVYTKDSFPYQFATINLNLGVTYMYFYENTKNIDYLSKSITSFNIAVKFFTFKEYPDDYAKIQNNLGQIYLTLSKIKEEKGNLEKSIIFFREALKVREFKTYPFIYAHINYNLGIAYYKLNKISNNAKYLKIGLEAYDNALKFYKLEDYPEEFSEIHFNLGGYYRKLAEYKNREINLKKAIIHFEESLKVIKSDSHSVKYQITNSYIGSICFDLLEIEENEEFIRGGIRAYSNIIKNLSKTNNPRNYAAMISNLGNLYGHLAKKENIKQNLKQSIDAFDQAMGIYKQLKLDEELKKTISYLSETLFFYGFLIEDKVVCLEAIEYYMKIQHDIENLADNELKSEIFNYIGMIYRKLSNFENKIENLESSKKYYKKALEIINKESEEYGVVFNNLALVYQNLSDLIDFKENLIKSLSNYNKALKFLTKKNESIIKNIKKNILIITQKLEKFESRLEEFKKQFLPSIRFLPLKVKFIYLIRHSKINRITLKI